MASIIGLAVAVPGCEPVEAPSRIVERVERAGAGDVRHASEAGLGMFFSSRPELATEVSRMCKDRSAEAGVPGKTEARICSAAGPVAFFRFVPAKPGQGKSFDCCSISR